MGGTAAARRRGIVSRLAGRVVATTRDGAPDDALVTLLEREGASVRVWPTVAFDPPSDPETLRRAAERVHAYDWVVFTSVRSVEPLVASGAPPGEGTRVAAVGDATAEALRAAGWRVDAIGDEGAHALVEAMAAAADLQATRVLFPASSRAAPTLEERLAARGARVDRIEAYRTRLVPPDPERVLADLGAGVDVVAFASPSAVVSLARALGDRWPDALGGAGCAAIGQSTRAALLEARVPPDRVETAAPPSLAGLVDVCVKLVEASGAGRAPRAGDEDPSPGERGAVP